MMGRPAILTSLAVLAAAFTTNNLVVVDAAASDQCKQETQALQNDDFLSLVQNDLYDIYVNDYNEVCDVGQLDCSLSFSGENKTYVAACEDKGGQVLTRHVSVRCGVSVATFDFGLGQVPACIGASCDASAVDGNELNETRVEQLLTDLKFTGCKTLFSGASVTYCASSLVVVMAGLVGVYFA